MNRIEKIKSKWGKAVGMILLVLLMLYGTSYDSRVYSVEGEVEKVLAPEIYYHLDMGVQLVSYNGVIWDDGFEYGVSSRSDISTSIQFGQEIKVNEVYPLESVKGLQRYDFGGYTSSDNIPSSLGSGQEAYNYYYKDYVSSLMDVNTWGGAGKTASFMYDAFLGTFKVLEVTEYGELGRGEYIYSLFGGAALLQSSQPEIYDSITQALEQGASGTSGNSKLFLVFCPNVIEYQKFIEIADLTADLALPVSVKQGELYTVEDISLIDDVLTVERAVLEKRLGSEADQPGLEGTDSGTNWETAANWSGSLPGENTGGLLVEQAGEPGIVSYKLTVTANTGQIDQVIKTIRIVDGREIQGTAKLNLQSVTYEGHPAWAIDESTFTVDGQSYSGTRAYEEKAATNRFVPQSGSGGEAFRENLTQAKVMFPVRGLYNVRLDVILADSSLLEDTKPIEVRKTPCISASLGGVQKQNRRQILTAAVATYPGKPVTDFFIEVTDLNTGEKIVLTKAAPQNNNAVIKTRPLLTGGGAEQQDPMGNDAYWTSFTLEFLTKTPVFMPGLENPGQEFQYKIWVMDSKGDTDVVEQVFRVMPDLPPVPGILIQDTFLREEGTNTAHIQMEDGTATDGDQIERIWSAGGELIENLNGFQDFSFGSRQHVQFEKTGVGPVNVLLQVKEVWIEPTLEEYITEEDYKRGDITGTAEVINVAPVVSLKAVKGVEARLIIAATPEEYPLFHNQLNSMKARFLDNGVTPQIDIIKRAPEDAGGYRQVYSKTWVSAMWCPSKCGEAGPIYDSEYVYTTRSNSIVPASYTQTCNGSHTIYADSVKDALPRWNYTVNQVTNFHIELDNREKYVYVIFPDLGSTVILNRNTGAEVAILPVALNGKIFLNQSNEIFVADAWQIAKLDSAASKLEKVSEGGDLIRLIEGMITFVTKDPAGKYGNRFYLGQYDMDLGILSGRALPEIPIEGINWTAGNKTDITPVEMDLNGKVIFIQTYSNLSHGTVQNSSIWVADSRTQEVQSAAFVTPASSVLYTVKGISAGFVTASTGEGKYVYVSYYVDEKKSSLTVKWTFKLYEVKMDTGLPLTEVMVTGRQTNTSNFAGISYSRIHESENKMYILRGNAFQSSGWGGNLSGERMTINLPAYSRGELVTQWDIADEAATDNGFLSATGYYYEQWINPETRVKIFKNSITGSQAIEQAVNKNVSDGDAGSTHILGELVPIQAAIETAIDSICLQAKEYAKAGKGLELAIGQGITRTIASKAESRYRFEYEIFTSAGAVTRVLYPPEYQGINPNQPGSSHYKKVAAILDFTNTASVSGNTYYTLSKTTYLEGRAGYGSGYYGKTGQTRTYSFTVSQNMEKPGYTEFDLFNYFGYQSSGGWSISVDGVLFDSGLGPLETHRTVFLETGEHQIKFSGVCSTGYTGYIGITGIQTVYYQSYTGDAFIEMFSQGSLWNNGAGSFTVSPEPLFNLAEETKTNMMRETFPGNQVNLTAYLEFVNDSTCLWNFNSTGGVASMTATYDVVAIGSFGVTAPADKGLIVTYDETLLFEVAGATSTLTGGSKRIGGSTFFIAPGQTFFRNYVLQKGRNGGTGSVKLQNIRVVEIPSLIPGEAVFADNGALPVAIGTRTEPFYSIRFFAPDSSSYSWKSYTDLQIKGIPKSGALTLMPESAPDSGFSLLKHFKLYEVIGGAKLLVLKQSFEDAGSVAADEWTVTTPGGEIKITTLEEQEEEEPSMVYKKGQLVATDIRYRDYEADPSKRQYWKYFHTPYNDGPHPNAIQLGPDGTIVNPDWEEIILDAPIERFAIDGKYTVYHWQEDNTARESLPLNSDGYPAGNPDYDKLSNVELLTFYVEGMSQAPWIKSIQTGVAQLGPDGTVSSFIPSIATEGEAFFLQIKIDDLEKDILRLKTEVYRNGKLIYQHEKEGIQATGGEYPPVVTGNAGIAQPGKYQVVCTVRDETGVGLGTYRFEVISAGKITGSVAHTDAWEMNRKEYNIKHEVLGDPETPRPMNYFWPGETFVVKAEVAGSPTIVKTEILGYLNSFGAEKYHCVMTSSGVKNEKGEVLYQGEIWDKEMVRIWSKQGPVLLLFRFTAIYGEYVLEPGGVVGPGEGSTVKCHEVEVIVDDRDSYLRLHRVW